MGEVLFRRDGDVVTAEWTPPDARDVRCSRQLIDQMVESMNALTRHQEVTKAALEVLKEWEAYIGAGDAAGHDDAVLVGEKMGILRAALLRVAKGDG